MANLQMDGDVQSYFSSTHGLIVPPPVHGRPGYSEPGIYGHQVGMQEQIATHQTQDASVGHHRVQRFQGKPAQESMHRAMEDGFATWVSHNALIDDDPSNDFEERSSRVLENLLTNDLPVHETQEQKKYKEEVLIKLRDILDIWMQRVKKKHGIPPDSPTGNAKLLPYGSYKLGVSSPTGDIDSLILAPYFVDRDEDFFGLLYPLLTELAANNDNIKELTMVNQQHTIMPLIKMTFYKVPIDMVFARVQYTESLEEFVRTKLYHEEYLQPMDEKMKRSFNGYRNAELILKSLSRDTAESDFTPETETWLNLKREEVFRTTLKCIKLWAKVNGLDSNKMGYLGGISWAILTAKVCKLFPYKCPARLLEKFFWLYGTEWHWDEWFVRIAKEYSDEHHSHGRTMYIITPSRPQMNSTHNVTLSTLEIMASRMRDAHRLVTEVLAKQEQREQLEPDDPTGKSEWNRLFTMYNFFDSYEHFIEANILGGKDADYLRWQGFVEAKIRMLCERFEDLLKFYDLKIHPWPNTYNRDPSTFKDYPQATTVYIGLKLGEEYSDTIDLNVPVIRFIEYLEVEWSRDNPARRDPLMYNVSIFYKQREEIPREVLRAEYEFPDAGDTDAETGRSLKESIAAEFREVQLSAHKSAMKDDFNQDLEPEEVELHQAISMGSITGHELRSPRLGPTTSLNFGLTGGPEMLQEEFDLYAQFDKAMGTKVSTGDAMLSKRSPIHISSIQNELDSPSLKSKRYSAGNDEIKLDNFSQQPDCKAPPKNRVDLWRNMKPPQHQQSSSAQQQDGIPDHSDHLK